MDCKFLLISFKYYDKIIWWVGKHLRHSGNAVQLEKLIISSEQTIQYILLMSDKNGQQKNLKFSLN